MTQGLLLPNRRLPAPLPPERVALNMAFGAGNPAILGDKSRYNSHGAITTAAVAAGLRGYCLDFVAANPDYVLIPAAHTQLNFIAEDFSIIARVRFDIIVIGYNQIFMRGELNVDGWQFEAFQSYLMFRTNQVAANTRARSPLGALVIDTDYTLGASRNGAVGHVFINGVDVTEATDAIANAITCARTAKIGVNDDLVQSPLDGRIEFLRIFRGIALTASEHLAWHNALA